MMNKTQLNIRLIDWAEAQQVLRQIRIEVFIQEQEVPAADEWDGLDESASHFLVQTQQGEAIASARVLLEVNSKAEQHYRIGRVAVLKPYRRQGVGQLLMRFIMDECLSQPGIAGLYLHAQTQCQHFYELLGFVAEGEEFMDAGIPHIAMRHDTNKHPGKFGNL